MDVANLFGKQLVSVSMAQLGRSQQVHVAIREGLGIFLVNQLMDAAAMIPKATVVCSFGPGKFEVGPTEDAKGLGFELCR